MILSFSAGEGHNSVAKALKEGYEKIGVTANIVDTISLISPALSRFVANGFAFVYRHIPSIFNFGYSYAEEHPSIFSNGTWVYGMLIMPIKNLLKKIREGNYDTIICTHPCSAVMLTLLLEKNPMDVKTAFVDTDYTCHPSTDHSNVMRYYIPDESLAEDFITKGLPKEKLVPSGIPIRQQFDVIKDKTSAKEELGIKNKRHMVMMCGSMGCGPIKKLCQRISAGLGEDDILSIVCGNNKSLKKGLDKLFAGNSKVRVLGFVKDVSTLMDSCDLYITKPGGISTSEASSKRLPMAFIYAVEGCEKYNREFFVNRGAAIAEKDIDRLSKRCLDLLHDDDTLKKMSDAFGDMPSKNAVKTVITDMKKEL